jgi:hypothetical protein
MLNKAFQNMTKYILIFASILLHSQLLSQAWQKCNVYTGEHGTGNTAVGIHNGKLFAANSTSGLQVSTNNGQTWTVVNADILNASEIVSTGARLYVVSSGFGCSDIYYSTNDGVSFAKDSIGLPVCGVVAGRNPLASITAFKDILVASLDGPDFEFTKKNSDTAWKDITYFDPNDPGNFAVRNDTMWATTNGSTSNGIAWSTDGLNWTSPVCNGIPIYYVPNHLAWVGNRVLVNGLDVSNGVGVDTILKYSDDYGNSFQDINIKQYLDGYAFFSFTGKQPIIGMYAGYNNLYLALGQDVLESAPELIVSTDKGNTFVKDTVGLPHNHLGSLFEITNMVFLNGWAFAQVNSGDVYRKKISSTSAIEEASLHPIKIYPNPAQSYFTISNPTQSNCTVCIYNCIGTQLSTYINPATINVSHLPKGNYFVTTQVGNLRHTHTLSIQ